MKKIGFIGYGVIGQQLAHFLKEQYHHQVEEYFFEDKTAGQSSHHLPFLDYKNPEYAHLDMYVCMGFSHLEQKREIFKELAGLGIKFPSYVHPSCYVHPTAKLEDGVYLWPMCCLDFECRIGRGSLLYNNSTVCHHSSVGECSFFGASVTLSGGCQVGDCTFLGSRVVVADGLSIGNKVKAAIGSVVTWSIRDNTSVYGYPLKKISNLNLKR